MKKILFSFIFCLLIFPKFVFAEQQINLYFFYGDGCPHCAKEEVFLEKLKRENKNIVVHSYETWNNRKNAELLIEVAKELNVSVNGVPFLVVGDRVIPGFYDEATTGRKIKDIIDNYKIYNCQDVVGAYMNDTDHQHGEDGCEVEKKKEIDIPETIKIPFIGEIKTSTISLPVLTFFIAATDGFNPCAMWVLLFLINLLLGMKEKKKMWILGTAFILSSGLVYFMFLSAWLNLFLFLEYVLWIRIAIAIVALASGAYHIKEWKDSRNQGCPVIGSEKRKQVFYRIREIIEAKSFYIAFGGIIVLAAAVNMVELVCSAGLPAIYTQILTMSDLPAWDYYIYLIFYILIFMADDILVFVVAMKTMEIKAGDNFFTKNSALIGGVIMLILGILLIFKPGWLMFG